MNFTSYFNDVIIAIMNEKEHREILEKVVYKAKKWNLKLNANKCNLLLITLSI